MILRLKTGYLHVMHAYVHFLGLFLHYYIQGRRVWLLSQQEIGKPRQKLNHWLAPMGRKCGPN